MNLKREKGAKPCRTQHFGHNFFIKNLQVKPPYSEFCIYQLIIWKVAFFYEYHVCFQTKSVSTSLRWSRFLGGGGLILLCCSARADQINQILAQILKYGLDCKMYRIYQNFDENILQHHCKTWGSHGGVHGRVHFGTFQTRRVRPHPWASNSTVQSLIFHLLLLNENF